MKKRKSRALDKLAGVHPDLVSRLARVLAAMEALGFVMMVTDGVRTQAQQQALYAKGRTAPGPIVTNADGVLRKSNHQTRSDGFGHAVDCTFVVNGKPTWDARMPWSCYGEAVKAVGLSWGGSWASLIDLPHVELTGAPATLNRPANEEKP